MNKKSISYLICATLIIISLLIVRHDIILFFSNEITLNEFLENNLVPSIFGIVTIIVCGIHVYIFEIQNN